MKSVLNSCVCLILMIVLSGTALAGQTLYKDRPARKAKVEIYTTAWCPYCRKAENFLRANGINFVNYDIEKDKSAAQRKAQLDNRRGVPLAVIDGQVIYGFSENLYRQALGLED